MYTVTKRKGPLRATRQMRLEELANVTTTDTTPTTTRKATSLSQATIHEEGVLRPSPIPTEDENTVPTQVQTKTKPRHGGSRNKQSYDDKRIVLDTSLMTRFLRDSVCGCVNKCLDKLGKNIDAGVDVLSTLRGARFAGGVSPHAPPFFWHVV